MSELSRDAKALIAVSRGQVDPSAADRARVRAKLAPAWAAQQRALATGGRGARRGGWLTRHGLWIALACLSASVQPAGGPHASRASRAATSGEAQPPASEPLARRERARPTFAGEADDERATARAGGRRESGVIAASGGGGRRAGSESVDVAANGGRGLHARAGTDSVGVAANRDGSRRARAGSEPLALAANGGSLRPAPAASDLQRVHFGDHARAETAPSLQRPSAHADDRASLACVAGPNRRSECANPTAVSAGAPSPAANGGEDASRGAAMTAGLRVRRVAPEQGGPSLALQPLDDELELLSGAQDALRRGQPSQALRLVQQHAFRFPRGALAQERAVVQALALCALDRRSAARVIIDDMKQRAPSSPLLTSVRRGCGL